MDKSDWSISDNEIAVDVISTIMKAEASRKIEDEVLKTDSLIPLQNYISNEMEEIKTDSLFKDEEGIKQALKTQEQQIKHIQTLLQSKENLIDHLQLFHLLETIQVFRTQGIGQIRNQYNRYVNSLLQTKKDPQVLIKEFETVHRNQSLLDNDRYLNYQSPSLEASINDTEQFYQGLDSKITGYNKQIENIKQLISMKDEYSQAIAKIKNTLETRITERKKVNKEINNIQENISKTIPKLSSDMGKLNLTEVISKKTKILELLDGVVGETIENIEHDPIVYDHAINSVNEGLDDLTEIFSSIMIYKKESELYKKKIKEKEKTEEIIREDISEIRTKLNLIENAESKLTKNIQELSRSIDLNTIQEIKNKFSSYLTKINQISTQLQITLPNGTPKDQYQNSLIFLKRDITNHQNKLFNEMKNKILYKPAETIESILTKEEKDFAKLVINNILNFSEIEIIDEAFQKEKKRKVEEISNKNKKIGISYNKAKQAYQQLNRYVKAIQDQKEPSKSKMNSESLTFKQALKNAQLEKHSYNGKTFSSADEVINYYVGEVRNQKEISEYIISYKWDKERLDQFLQVKASEKAISELKKQYDNNNKLINSYELEHIFENKGITYDIIELEKEVFEERERRNTFTTLFYKVLEKYDHKISKDDATKVTYKLKTVIGKKSLLRLKQTYSKRVKELKDRYNEYYEEMPTDLKNIFLLGKVYEDEQRDYCESLEEKCDGLKKQLKEEKNMTKSPLTILLESFLFNGKSKRYETYQSVGDGVYDEILSDVNMEINGNESIEKLAATPVSNEKKEDYVIYKNQGQDSTSTQFLDLYKLAITLYHIFTTDEPNHNFYNIYKKYITDFTSKKTSKTQNKIQDLYDQLGSFAKNTKEYIAVEIELQAEEKKLQQILGNNKTGINYTPIHRLMHHINKHFERNNKQFYKYINGKYKPLNDFEAFTKIKHTIDDYIQPEKILHNQGIEYKSARFILQTLTTYIQSIRRLEMHGKRGKNAYYNALTMAIRETKE